MKFCKDCKYSKRWGDDSNFYYGCEKKVIGKYTGFETKASIWMCERTREKQNLCGPTAKWFEWKSVEAPKYIFTTTIAPEPKIIPNCVECAYYHSEKIISVWHNCTHTRCTNGAPETGVMNCSTARSYEHLCGVYGKWFAKKQDTPKRKRRSWLCRLICGDKNG